MNTVIDRHILSLPTSFIASHCDNSGNSINYQVISAPDNGFEDTRLLNIAIWDLTQKNLKVGTH